MRDKVCAAAIEQVAQSFFDTREDNMASSVIIEGLRGLIDADAAHIKTRFLSVDASTGEIFL
jgi:hypothetical protein